MGKSTDNKNKTGSGYSQLYNDTRHAMSDPIVPKIVKQALSSLLDVHPKYLREARKNAGLYLQQREPDYAEEKHLVEEMDHLTSKVSHYVQHRHGRNWNFDLIEAAKGYEKAVSSAHSRLGRDSH